MSWRVGVERTVFHGPVEGFDAFEQQACLVADVALLKLLPDIIYGQLRRMNHVLVVETVVPQVVVDDFERWEIFVVWETLDDPVYGVEQYGLAPCVVDQAVSDVSDRTNAPQDPFVAETPFSQ